MQTLCVTNVICKVTEEKCTSPPLPIHEELVLGSTTPWQRVLCVQRVKVTGATWAHPVLAVSRWSHF